MHKAGFNCMMCCDVCCDMRCAKRVRFAVPI